MTRVSDLWFIRGETGCKKQTAMWYPTHHPLAVVMYEDVGGTIFQTNEVTNISVRVH